MMARHTYECKFCHQPIHPGDEYIGYVLVSLDHRLVVEREHPFCWPDDPWEEDEWEEWNQEDHIPDISPRAEPAPLKRAA
jgi:hypothetical protein